MRTRKMRTLTLRQYHNADRPDKRHFLLDSLPAPSLAIRAHCLECVDFHAADVRRCDGNLPHGKCHLHAHRLGTKRGVGSPSKAIRRECLTCMCDSPKGVAICPSTRCALWPYRFGANPRTSREARARFKSVDPRQRSFPNVGAASGALDDPEVVHDADGGMSVEIG